MIFGFWWSSTSSLHPPSPFSVFSYRCRYSTNPFSYLERWASFGKKKRKYQICLSFRLVVHFGSKSSLASKIGWLFLTFLSYTWIAISSCWRYPWILEGWGGLNQACRYWYCCFPCSFRSSLGSSAISCKEFLVRVFWRFHMLFLALPFTRIFWVPQRSYDQNVRYFDRWTPATF